MCLRIAHELSVLIVFFPVFYTSIDQGDGVSPHYPDDQYYPPAEQGKRDPHPLAYLILFYANYFLHYNIACGSKCQFDWIRVS